MLLLLDRETNSLVDDAGRVFDPRSRRWLAEDGRAPCGEPVTAEAAARWLQRESGTPVRLPVAVVGTRNADAAQSAAATLIGRRLAEVGFVVLCGGRAGVMEAVCRGVADAGGISIGLLPDEDAAHANPYVTVPLATGIGIARNALIARAAFCLVAIGGGYGTLSEIAFGLQFGKPVLGLAGAPAVTGVVACDTVETALQHVAEAALNLPPAPADPGQGPLP
jgi:uncharacterized protein (TIGR00725 family)